MIDRPSEEAANHFPRMVQVYSLVRVGPHRPGDQRSCSSESNRALGFTGPARSHPRSSSTCAVVASAGDVRPRGTLTPPAVASSTKTSRCDDLLSLSTVLELNQPLSLGRRGPSRSDNGANWETRSGVAPDWAGLQPAAFAARPSRQWSSMWTWRVTLPLARACKARRLPSGHARGPGEENRPRVRNRTCVSRSSGESSAIELRVASLVRVTGTAPATSRSRSERSSHRAPP